jgi:CTP synthase (UTP-ammonia lyase)
LALVPFAGFVFLCDEAVLFCRFGFMAPESIQGSRSARDVAAALSFSEKSTMTNAIRIGIIGDFEPAYHSHFATNAALYDAATKLNLPLIVRWIPTPALDSTDAPKILSRWDGLIASPGSPYKSFTGMLRGIEFARSRDWPFAGT